MSELSWPEKIGKASLYIREHPTFKQAYRYPVRALRLAAEET